MVMANALEGLGEVCSASSGEDALALLTRYPVDLIRLDANRPDLDGFATCHILGGRNRICLAEPDRAAASRTVD